MTPAALRRSFEFDARVPAGVEGIAVAVDRVEKLGEIATKKRQSLSNRFTNLLDAQQGMQLQLGTTTFTSL